jgi:DNA mismatch repair protein MSH5
LHDDGKQYCINHRTEFQWESIYLKEVGLIVYLGHIIGGFVPCERAIIGLTDQILTRISSEETVAVATPQSTFTIDLCQMSKILKYHT